MGKSLIKSTTRKRRRPLVLDSINRGQKTPTTERATHKQMQDAFRHRGLTRKNTASCIQRKRYVNRIFSESWRSNIEEDIQVSRWNSLATTFPFIRSWGRGFCWLNAREIVSADLKSPITSHHLDPDLKGQGSGSCKTNRKMSNILRCEFKLTRDIYRPIARSQESDGLVPGLIHIKHVSYKDILFRGQYLDWLLRTGHRVVFVMGPPASGKGTYCEEIKKRLNMKHVSTGELLREEVAANSNVGKSVSQVMKRGDLVDSSTATKLLQKYLRANRRKHVLVDGFPRSVQNSTDFLRLWGRPEFALMFDAPDEVLIERMRNRAAISFRDDDKDENTCRKRIEVFRKTIPKIVENLKNSGVDVYTIDATLPKEENVEKIVSLMKRF